MRENRQTGNQNNTRRQIDKDRAGGRGSHDFEMDRRRARVTHSFRRAKAEQTAQANEAEAGSGKRWWSPSDRGPRWSQREGGVPRSQWDKVKPDE